MHTVYLHAYVLTVSMATKGSHLIGNLWAHPVDVTQHYGPDWEGLLMSDQTWVVSPGENEKECIEMK